MVENAKRIISSKLAVTLKKRRGEISGQTWDDIVMALGEVAAGVAHEIRNPLTGIKGFGQLLQSRFTPEDAEWPYVSNILKETEKIENLIEELIMVARPTFPRRNWVALSTMVDEVLPLLAREAVTNRVMVATDYDEELPLIKLDPHQFKAVLLQLGKEALQAMEKGEVLKISTYRREEFAEVSFLRPQSTFKSDVIYRDLGITAIKRIIENHNGILETKNVEGHGSTLSIRLPLD